MPKHDHDKHKHDHDKHKHDHDHEKHKHDHDKHKHDHDHEASEEPPIVDDTSEEPPIVDDTSEEPPIVDARVVTPVAVPVAAAAAVAAAVAYSKPVEEVQEAMASTNISSPSSSPKKKKLPIKSSQMYGGEGGESFDDGFHKRIIEVGVSSGAIVDNVTFLYHGGQSVTHGGRGGGEKKLTLREDEYIVEINVRASKIVKCLTFTTNLGRTLGPCGGKGGLLLPGGIGGKETTVSAPGEGYGLKGIKGRKGKYLDAIGFHWGTVSTSSD